MTRALNILVACAAAISLSAPICAQAGAQPSGLAPATQPEGNIGHSEAGSVIAWPLLTPANTALADQPPPPFSVTTRALLPGHWALNGSDYVWVPPETRLRAVQAAPLVQGSYVWRYGSYVWVPMHYSNP